MLVTECLLNIVVKKVIKKWCVYVGPTQNWRSPSLMLFINH